MRTRMLSAVGALVLASVTLTACRSNVGTAATVSGHRISENTVSDYVDKTSSPKPDSNGQKPAPKAAVLQILVLQRVFRDTLRSNGGVPSSGALAALHDEALTVLTQGQVDPKAYDSSLRTQLPASGIKASLAPTVVQVQELEYAVIKKLQLRTQVELAAAVRKAGVTVSVNPRYGTWNAAQALFSTTGATPSYLTLQPSV